MEDISSAYKLRFRINLLLAQQDMTVKVLYDKVKLLGYQGSSSHFYRQMKPYFSPVRLDVLSYVVQALKIDASELFELVEVEVNSEGSESKGPAMKTVAPARKLIEKEEKKQIESALSESKKRKALALLGAKIVVNPNLKDGDE